MHNMSKKVSRLSRLSRFFPYSTLPSTYLFCKYIVGVLDRKKVGQVGQVGQLESWVAKEVVITAQSDSIVPESKSDESGDTNTGS